MPGELVELFIQFLDRETELEPHWWHTYGSFTLLNFTAGFFPEHMARGDAMGALREVLEVAINDGGVAEDFLIRALKRDLDDFVRGKEDPSAYNRTTDRTRETMRDVIENPVARANWRKAMAQVNPTYASKTDEELIADARNTIENSVTTRHLDADAVAQRWSEADEWWELSAQLLPDSLFEHWGRLRTKRAIDEDRQRRTQD
ncbi:hypothetical protein GCM10009725_03870 [Aeromicrobium tamlense]